MEFHLKQDIFSQALKHQRRFSLSEEYGESPLGDLGANEVTLGDLGAKGEHHSSGNSLNEVAKSLTL
jgi:hypothetical protein